MGGIGDYEFLAEATADGAIKLPTERKHTEVAGMPDVDLVVSESKRVLDVGGTTKFLVRLRNYGTKAATNIQVNATLSDNLEVQDAGGGSKDVAVAVEREENRRQVRSNRDARARQGDAAGNPGQGRRRRAQARHLPRLRRRTTT